MIPKILHRIWIGSPEPDEFVEYGRSWVRHHPDWFMTFWTEQEIIALQNVDLYRRAREIAPGSPEQFMSDVARYEILYHLGGLYVDADLECLKNVEPLIGDADLFAAWEVDGRWIGNTIMGAAPGHPFLKALIDGLPRNVRANPGKAPNRLSGPQYVTRLYHELRPQIRLAPSKFIFPYAYNELHREHEQFPQAYAKHVWNNRRRKLKA